MNDTREFRRTPHPLSESPSQSRAGPKDGRKLSVSTTQPLPTALADLYAPVAGSLAEVEQLLLTELIKNTEMTDPDYENLGEALKLVAASAQG